MSVKSLQNVRESKPFRPADLIVYGVLIALIAALLTAFVFTRAAVPLSEIYADVGGERVLAWSVAAEKLTVTAVWQDRAEVTATAGATTVRLYIDEHGHYNVIEFTAAGAKITDANCSAHKDCVHTPALTDAADVIICVPHKLKLYSSGEREPSLG